MRKTPYIKRLLLVRPRILLSPQVPLKIESGEDMAFHILHQTTPVTVDVNVGLECH